MGGPRILTPAERLAIWERFRLGDKRADLAREYGVSYDTVYHIAARETPPELPADMPMTTLSDAERVEACRRVLRGEPIAAVARDLALGYQATLCEVRRVIRRPDLWPASWGVAERRR
jgi:hypothetical protein